MNKSCATLTTLQRMLFMVLTENPMSIVTTFHPNIMNTRQIANSMKRLTSSSSIRIKASVLITFIRSSNRGLFFLLYSCDEISAHRSYQRNLRFPISIKLDGTCLGARFSHLVKLNHFLFEFISQLSNFVLNSLQNERDHKVTVVTQA